jgi:UDP-N-acetylglucosamine 1-carboxyvinyltransferase
VEVDLYVQTDGRGRALVRVPMALRPVTCVARPYPAIPTDVQAQLTSLLTRAEGVSVVGDAVFPTRFMHVSELCRMGADVRREDRGVVIHGGRPLEGASVMASDLRASAGLVIAALTARGETTIRRIYHLDRGYERLEDKLRSLGGEVQRVADAGAAIPEDVVPAATIDARPDTDYQEPARAA